MLFLDRDISTFSLFIPYLIEIGHCVQTDSANPPCSNLLQHARTIFTKMIAKILPHELVTFKKLHFLFKTGVLINDEYFRAQRINFAACNFK